MFKIHYYTTARGKEAVRDFTLNLAPKTQAKVLKTIDYLREAGPTLQRPYADVVKGKIRELRIRFASDQIRILYFIFQQETIVLLHGFRKKTDAIPVTEIAQAERYMNDFITRYFKGEYIL